MDYNDGNQWHYVLDPPAYAAARTVYEMRAMSGTTGTMLVDTRWAQQRAAVGPLVECFVHYQKPYAGQSPERQAGDFCALVDELRPNEAVLYDGEADLDVPDRVDFARRWLGVVEPRLGTLCQVYVPGALRGEFPRSVTGPRLVKAPHYSATPTWPHDIHQFSDRASFPGGNGPGDANRTALTAAQILARCRPASDLDWTTPLARIQ